MKGKWAVFFFYPADFTFVCPTELEDLADIYGELQGLSGAKSIRARPHTSHFQLAKGWQTTIPAANRQDQLF
ncbi:MAG: redoxin domain-containing protein [Sphingobium sp.]|nr:redoxin domain-containing protein [Sphingobium sp.]